jgi:protein-S-isoprenylcysteine O-methyltransferase Ste14
MAWGAVSLPLWLRWIGITMGVCAGVLLVWTFHNLGRNLTDTVVTRQKHTLVTSGPYRYIRHPFYMSFALGMIGAALAAANWFMLLAGLVPLAFLMIRTRIEEEKLIARFGDQYRDYMQRVGRFLPRLR